MNIQPFDDINGPLAVHLATVAVSLVASAYIFVAAKGTRGHKFAGRIAASALMITALASFGINSFSAPYFGLSAIHLFSVVVLFFVPYALWQVRRGNVDAHRKAMTGVALGGLGIAGALTLLPGRMMAEVFFG